jgi:hypothetical protein
MYKTKNLVTKYTVVNIPETAIELEELINNSEYTFFQLTEKFVLFKYTYFLVKEIENEKVIKEYIEV